MFVNLLSFLFMVMRHFYGGSRRFFTSEFVLFLSQCFSWEIKVVPLLFERVDVARVPSIFYNIL